MGLRRCVQQFVGFLHLLQKEDALEKIEILLDRGYALADGEPGLEALRALVQARYEGVRYIPKWGVLIILHCRVKAEDSLQLLLDLGRNGEKTDLERVLLVERGLEVGYEHADQASQIGADQADVIVDGANPLRKILVDSGEEVTAETQKS